VPVARRSAVASAAAHEQARSPQRAEAQLANDRSGGPAATAVPRREGETASVPMPERYGIGLDIGANSIRRSSMLLLGRTTASGAKA
jgi:hypothetical protein